MLLWLLYFSSRVTTIYLSRPTSFYRNGVEEVSTWLFDSVNLKVSSFRSGKFVFSGNKDVV